MLFVFVILVCIGIACGSTSGTIERNSLLGIHGLLWNLLEMAWIGLDLTGLDWITISIHCVAGLDKTHLEGQFGVSPGGLIFRLKFGFESSHSWSRSALIGRHCRVSLVGGGLGVGRELRCCSREFVRVRARSSMAPPMVTDVSLPSAGRVLSIQSHTVHGYVGNKAAVFPLQLLGFDVDPINSVQFSNHTGYGTVKGQVLDGDELWALIEGLEANELLSYTHLLTGYIGSVSFLETVLRVVEKLRSVNPNLIYVCDPVMGDDGKFYVTPELVPVYREKVVPVATMITPNHFEAEQLTGRRIETEAEALQACADLHAAGPSKVVITSLSIDNMLTVLGSHVQSKGKAPKQFKIVLPKLHSYFTGTGDLMTALLLGWSHKFPDDLDKAAELAVSSLQAVLKNTIAGYDDAGVLPKPKTKLLELRLIQSVKEIQSPVINFFTEKLEQ